MSSQIFDCHALKTSFRAKIHAESFWNVVVTIVTDDAILDHAKLAGKLQRRSAGVEEDTKKCLVTKLLFVILNAITSEIVGGIRANERYTDVILAPLYGYL